ncbi:DUF6670 family protein [Amycolatopsis sp. VS8301801F10]|uniref:DUF6670 family protein n=1 Tax=Amycolatopsis sp. VS8301801F10 TaxID=2652442 RepID=UPI0038FC38EB
MGGAVRRRSAAALIAAARRFLNGGAETDAPFPHREFLRPHTTGRRYTAAHWNVVIPDLPAPHRFLGCATLVGRPGMRAFDIDHAVAGSPRTTLTLAVGTAATAPDWFSAYHVFDDCDLLPDGSRLRVADVLTIAGRFPSYRIQIRRPDFALDLEAECADRITRFIRSPVYDHLGYPATYRGTLRWHGESRPVEGLLSLEYARVSSTTAIADRPVPRALKMPIDVFTWQVIKLGPRTLLMLAGMGMGGRMAPAAYLKDLDGEDRRQVRGVRLDVLEYHDEPVIAPDGARTRLPRRFRWFIPAGSGSPTELSVVTDSHVIYGLGRGWLGGMDYEGTHNGQPVAGTGYYEYVGLARNVG